MSETTYAVCECGNDKFIECLRIDVKGELVVKRIENACESCGKPLAAASSGDTETGGTT